MIGPVAWQMRAVGSEFLETSSHRFVYTTVIRHPPGRVFDAIARRPAEIGEWYPGFDRSGTWSSADDPGAGSRRRVRMAGVTYDDTVLVWEPPSRFAFRVDRAGLPIARAVAEGYRILPHPSGSAVEWVFAIDPHRALEPLTSWFDPALARLFARASANLEKHLSR
ncbi:MAG: SRPBCC family protein [Acidobacteriota bacterium]|nr:SRPBCC family protein [Acidobacteriota bacterium]